MGGRHWGNRSEWEAAEAHARILALYRQGEKVSYIAAITDYSDRTVFRVIRAAGLERRIFPRKVTEEERERIRELARAGTPITRIAQILERRARVVTPIIDAAGIKRRKEGEWWPGDREDQHFNGKDGHATIRE